MKFLKFLFENPEIQNVIAFFQNRLTLIDFIIIGLGLFLILYQIWLRLTSSATKLLENARKNPLFLKEVELRIHYINTLIEMLPILGILGTVWGLMCALYVIQTVEAPTISDIASNIAPAISTTFFGLVFSVINLFISNFLHVYLYEIIEWCEYSIKRAESSESKDSSKRSRPDPSITGIIEIRKEKG